MKICTRPLSSISLLWIVLCCQLYLPSSAGAQVTEDHLFEQYRTAADSALLAMDRQRVRDLGYRMQQIALESGQAQHQKWASFYIAEGLLRENPVEAERFATEALQRFQEQGSHYDVGRCHNLLGNIATNRDEMAAATAHYQKAIQRYEKATTPDNRAAMELMITKVLANMGYAYTKQSRFDEAADLLFAAEAKAITLKDTMLLCVVTNSIGNVFFLAEQFAKSKVYYRKTGQLAVSERFKLVRHQSLTNLGNVSLHLGQLDSALYYQSQAVIAAKNTSNIVSLNTAQSNLANVYMKMQDCRKADSINREVLVLATQLDLPRAQANAYLNLAECAQKRKDYTQALAYAQQSRALIQGNNDLDFIRSVHLLLSNIYEGQQQYAAALDQYQQYKAASDSLLNEANLAKVEELQTRYETEQKEREIGRLSEANRIQQLEFRQQITWLVAGLVSLSFIALAFFFYHRQRLLLTDKRALELEQRLLRSQMNPHFIFNALASIQTYLLQDGQAQRGAYYLTKFAKLMRQTLEHSRVTFVPLAEELEMLDHYLALQQLRYDEQFSYTIEVEPDLPTDQLELPPLLLQPVIENAIEHGDLHQQPDGWVKVKVGYAAQDRLRISIRDNGRGRIATSAKKFNNQPYTSISSGIIQDRIRLLQKQYRDHISYRVTDPPTGGTQVVYEFPLSYRKKMLANPIAT